MRHERAFQVPGRHAYSYGRSASPCLCREVPGILTDARVGAAIREPAPRQVLSGEAPGYGHSVAAGTTEGPSSCLADTWMDYARPSRGQVPVRPCGLAGCCVRSGWPWRLRFFTITIMLTVMISVWL